MERQKPLTSRGASAIAMAVEGHLATNKNPASAAARRRFRTSRTGRPRSRRDCLRDGCATPRETALAVGADPV
jgi:hypothetical protein